MDIEYKSLSFLLFLLIVSFNYDLSSQLHSVLPNGPLDFLLTGRNQRSAALIPLFRRENLELMDITDARGTSRIIYSPALLGTLIHVRIRPKCTTLQHTLSLKEKVVLITEVDTTNAGMHRLH